jgi:hypothetical protein
MKYARNRFGLAAVAAAITITFPLNASADDAYDALKSQVEALQKQLQQVQQSLQQYQQQAATKEEVQEVKQEVEDVSSLQSEWKNTDSVVHLAGYGDVTYSDGDNATGAFSGVRFNPIFHYQYKDLVMLEGELEFEVAEDGETEMALEYLTIDLLVNDYLTLVAGQFLSPIGQFRQNLHPSWINKLPTAPPGFGHDGAAPLSDVGLQARGGFPVGNPMFANYAVYVGNGPVLEFEEEMPGEFEVHALEAEGRTSNDDDELVLGGRFGLLPIPMLEVGLSGATGKVNGENPSTGDLDVDRDYSALGADFAWKWNNLGLRGEYIKQKVDANASSIDPSAYTWEAWYAQAAYRFEPTNWEGVVRFTDFDSPHADDDQKQWALGINYLFAPNAIAKLGYNFNDGESGEPTDDDRFQVQFAYGF